MTTVQIFLMIGFYLGVFVAVIHFTRAKVRHVLGALAGSAVFGLVGIAAVALGEAQGWWRVPSAGVAHFQLLLWVGLTVSCAPDYLIVWKVMQRFGRRGLVVCVIVVAIIGPPRDYWIAATFPKWMTFAPGIIPVLADATVYVLLVVTGVAVMRVVVGQAHWSALAVRK